MKAYAEYSHGAYNIDTSQKKQENSACLNSLTREVPTHIRTDAQGGPLIPVFAVKTPHE